MFESRDHVSENQQEFWVETRSVIIVMALLPKAPLKQGYSILPESLGETLDALALISQLSAGKIHPAMTMGLAVLEIPLTRNFSIFPKRRPLTVRHLP